MYKCFFKEIYYEGLFKVLLIRDLYESAGISAFHSSRSKVGPPVKSRCVTLGVRNL